MNPAAIVLHPFTVARRYLVLQHLQRHGAFRSTVVVRDHQLDVHSGLVHQERLWRQLLRHAAAIDRYDRVTALSRNTEPIER